MCLSPTQRALRGTKLWWRAPGASPGSQGSALCHLHPALQGPKTADYTQRGGGGSPGLQTLRRGKGKWAGHSAPLHVPHTRAPFVPMRSLRRPPLAPRPSGWGEPGHRLCKRCLNHSIRLPVTQEKKTPRPPPAQDHLPSGDKKQKRRCRPIPAAATVSRASPPADEHSALKCAGAPGSSR